MEVEEIAGVLRVQFERQRQRFAGQWVKYELKSTEQCPDYGVNTSFDGKAVELHSTGRRFASRTDPASGGGMTSDPDAAWSCHQPIPHRCQRQGAGHREILVWLLTERTQ